MLAWVAVVSTINAQSIAPSPGIREAVNRRDGAVVCFVPSGSVTLGGYLPLPATSENFLQPCSVEIPGFWIYKHEVTYGQFQRFLKATKRSRKERIIGAYKDDLPMILVNWEEAQAYCQWAGGTLPAEAQWEKAARGTDGRRFTWGETFDRSFIASRDSPDLSREGGMVGPVAVSTYHQGASPYGVLHMIGNVSEWCLDAFDPKFVPTARELVCRKSPPRHKGLHVVRGGSYASLCDEVHLNALVRVGGARPTAVDGFRCVLAEPWHP